MRLAIILFVVCVLIFSSVRIRSLDHAVARKTLLSRFCCHNDKRGSSKQTAMAEAMTTFFSSKKNQTLDEKRLVPTGPNPLHNR
ncbi:hypothetical protein SLE2022_273220 [Rubroshorea leprosula]